jgi:hypothetical protein
VAFELEAEDSDVMYGGSEGTNEVHNQAGLDACRNLILDAEAIELVRVPFPSLSLSQPEELLTLVVSSIDYSLACFAGVANKAVLPTDL